jgi:hypothetical protein
MTTSGANPLDDTHAVGFVDGGTDLDYGSLIPHPDWIHIV